MKLSVAAVIFPLLAPALAAPSANLSERDIATIKNVLSDIDTQVNNLGSAITAKPLQADSIVSQADKLSTTITSGTSTVNGQDQLSQLDALGLVSPTQKLADDTDKTIKSLIGVKSDVNGLGKGCVTLQSLQKLDDGAKSLSSAIVSKVPSALGDIAGNLADSIAEHIQKGVDAYQGACDKKAEAAEQPAETKPAPAPAATQAPAEAPAPAPAPTESAQPTKAPVTKPKGSCAARN
ncbi:hydrophobic surface binding protein A-domain-containing protein [Aspergillus multicolor]|uniref:cell wall mannoprotein 1 family protein n=1 Tax=Aspergillus multicolor TaxID=41759 RepID=UPI003CCCC17C